MKINLRKANAIQQALQGVIHGISIITRISLNEFQDPIAVLEAANRNAITADNRRSALTDALFCIRADIGYQNAMSQVSHKLAAIAFIDKRLGQLSGLVDTANLQLDSDVLTGRLNKLKMPATNVPVYNTVSTVDSGVFTADQINTYKALITQLKKQKLQINDEILELNINTTIELHQNVVELLTTEGII